MVNCNHSITGFLDCTSQESMVLCYLVKHPRNGQCHGNHSLERNRRELPFLPGQNGKEYIIIYSKQSISTMKLFCERTVIKDGEKSTHQHYQSLIPIPICSGSAKSKEPKRKIPNGVKSLISFHPYQ